MALVPLVGVGAGKAALSLGDVGKAAGRVDDVGDIARAAGRLDEAEDIARAAGRLDEVEDIARVRLYRAIGESELDDVLRFGDYGLSPGGGGKYFALTEEGARAFASSDFNAGRRMTITSIEVPESFLERGYQFFDVGGAGPSIHFADDVLPDLYETAGLPEIIEAPWVPGIAAQGGAGARALVPYDPDFAALQSEFPWEFRIKGKTPEEYRQTGMLTRQEYGAFLEARQRFPEVEVLGPGGPGQFVMRAPNDLTLTGSHAATPAELYNRYQLTQLSPEMIKHLPDDIRWRVEADRLKLGGPSYGDIELHTRYRWFDPESGKFRPFRETEQALEFVRQRAPGLQWKEIDWGYLQHEDWWIKRPPGIHFGPRGTYRIPAPWGPSPPRGGGVR